MLDDTALSPLKPSELSVEPEDYHTLFPPAVELVMTPGKRPVTRTPGRDFHTYKDSPGAANAGKKIAGLPVAGFFLAKPFEWIRQW